MTELEQMAGDETSTLAMIAGGDIACCGGAVDDGDRHRDIRRRNRRPARRYHDQRIDAAGDHSPDFEILLLRIALTITDQNGKTAPLGGSFDGLGKGGKQWLADIRDQQADRIALAGAQSAGRMVRHIAEPVRFHTDLCRKG